MSADFMDPCQRWSNTKQVLVMDCEATWARRGGPMLLHGAVLLAGEEIKIGRRHITTLMRKMGMESLYCGPCTTKPESGHKTSPYLPRGPAIKLPNHVWTMDITYIPMAFVYLAVVLDWESRRVLSSTVLRTV